MTQIVNGCNKIQVQYTKPHIRDCMKMTAVVIYTATSITKC